MLFEPLTEQYLFPSMAMMMIAAMCGISIAVVVTMWLRGYFSRQLKDSSDYSKVIDINNLGNIRSNRIRKISK